RPEDWWAASVEVTRRVVADADGRNVAAISLTGQMHGVVLLDTHGIPLGDAIIWNDQRSVEEVGALVEPLGRERFTAIAGTLPATGFMGASLLWLKRHLPGRLEQASAALFPKDYVRYRLTGEIAVEPSDAASSALFDVGAGVWSDEIINAVGLPRPIFPNI
ncbi:MAG: xylulokinase, partial [Phototrophicales bacterium]